MTPNRTEAHTDDADLKHQDESAEPALDDATESVVEERLEELESSLHEAEDNWRRAAADLDNLRKRLARDVAQAKSQERARVASMMLPAVDNLDLALEHARDDDSAIVEGVRVIRDQILAVLEGLGYRRYADVDVPFDPQRHEVVSVVESPDLEPGTVVAVVRPGYGEGPSQLRPASVVVARRPG
jgi:molecular chaperone GrpE